MNFTKNQAKSESHSSSDPQAKTQAKPQAKTQAKPQAKTRNIKVDITEKDSELPFVSVCTPTFNRRPFIPFLVECFQKQDYPKNRMEWIIVDDGDDKIADLLVNIPQVRYFQSSKKIALGKKRNMMNNKCKGDIIVYMDDDDYYPPTRVSHAVETLENNTLYDVVGCDNISIYFGKPEEKSYKIGPYHDNHATAATLAFRNSFLKNHSFDDNRVFGEESSFLNNFTVPIIKLDADKTIVVFSHSLNTIDKRFIFKNEKHHKVKIVEKDLSYVITNEKYREFVENNDDYVKDYEYGKLEFKKDIVEKMETIEKENNNKLSIVENLREKLNEHTKDELINIILNLKVEQYMKGKKKSTNKSL
tara:strand:- start:160 stop:1239 length:1080 start_codon:yes stop_codon:yes gene_type:complete